MRAPVDAWQVGQDCCAPPAAAPAAPPDRPPRVPTAPTGGAHRTCDGLGGSQSRLGGDVEPRTKPLVTRVFVDRAAWAEGALLTVTVLLAVAILQGMLAFLKTGRLQPERHALAVDPDEQPELWGLVRAAAEATGERPPDELYLEARVNAAVAEQSRLLGLLPGRRRMYIGLPLLVGTTVPQLRAVLAHEFGHYAHLDARLGGVVMRGRAAVLHTVDVFGRNDTWFHRAVGMLYVNYAHLFLRTSQAMGREQELAADRTAARHAGRDVTAAALRALPVLDAAHEHYLTAYVGMGEPVGALPQRGEVYGGFRRMIDARSPEGIAELSTGRRPPRPHAYDSHPPITERVALIEASAEDGRVGELDDKRSSLTLLHNVEVALFTGCGFWHRSWGPIAEGDSVVRI